MGALPRKKISTDRLFYKIGEISSLAEIEPHVLRYWESEFPFLKPRKNKTGQRMYTRKDLELVLQIKNLLYKEKYTIAGVKKKFGSSRQKKNSVSMETIQGVKKKLKEILDTLNRDLSSENPPAGPDKKNNSRLFL
jgi:DNA-binding transcriptional MerR regulator